MESSGAGIGRLDCYEDMFKEITRKLYGDDPDHRTSSVQNEFETSVSYKTEDDTDHGTDGSDDGNWTCEDEPLKGTDGSRIAAYHAGKTTWRCYECGDCMGGGPRDVAEHFVELHSSRIMGDETRARHHHHHSPRKDYLQNDLKVEEVVSYLERVRDRAERSAPPSRRTQETQTVPAALLPATTTFLIQELPTVSPSGQQHLHQNSTTMTTTGSTPSSGKRYTCPNCPYGTDRRDLYTRHENIHREEKPFHCYVCYKPFNRADHVKKHFLRMHREHGYELSRIRRTASTSGGGGTVVATGGAVVAGSTTTTATTTTTKTLQPETSNVTTTIANGNAIVQNTNYGTGFNNNKGYQLQTGQNSNGAGGAIYQTTATIPVTGIVQGDVNCTPVNRRIQNGGCNSKSHVKGGTKGNQERRYTCCYCSWSGVDNWCLKRHLNTHLKPFACALCEYKAARAERLATHVLKVHNKRQCSRCSFLGEDAAQLQVHQLHVHRVSSASAPASTVQQAATPNNRHQQPVHPSGGGRPPPGPPVFPASSPTIVTAPSVIPPTTILGKFGLTDSKLALVYQNWLSLLQQNRSNDREATRNGGNSSGRRSRKQSTPRKVMIDDDDDDDDQDDRDDDIACGQSTLKSRLPQTINSSPVNEKITKEYFRCYQCPDDSPARGTSCKPYHTKASLALHRLWRHRRSRNGAKSSSENVALKEQQKQTTETPRSSITLKATVITTSNYHYQR